MARADIVVYDQTKNIQLIVEVKNKLGASREWAAQMRRNLLTHAVVPNAPYFLLALPDLSYLWVDSHTQSGEILPSYEFKTKDILFPYVNEVNSELPEKKNGSNLQWLFDSGLYEAIKGGAVATEAIA
jgi:hypothetical protein